ncbi:hypothetical protein OIU85_021182 [Salix viminalis]|uniref:Uncharacterized protein n=1 Tax=Salix viminalis TaxID=40686 RepID=A0A9Q0UI54_SALVM|nr:hypothetical protein OIU85_021182 [Salix viminalis]
MVSFQALPSPSGKKLIPELNDSSKKRKWEEPQAEGILEKRSNPETRKSFFEIESHLETPLPSGVAKMPRYSVREDTFL